MNVASGYIRNLRVFVSSPGDLQSERDIVTRVCEEITLDLGSIRKFRLEPVKWETHVHSGIADRSQQVILDGIGDYDIYLGVMGYYFGSDTGKYASGTEEEFREALNRYEKDQQPRIQFYFSSASVSPDEIDLTQHEKVKAFRSDVGAKGVFYRRFEDLVSFEALVRGALIADIHKILEADETLPEDGRPNEMPQYSDLKPYDRLKNLSTLFKVDKRAAAQLLTQDSLSKMNAVTDDLNTATARIAAFSKSMAVATRESRAAAVNPKKKKYLLKKIDDVFRHMEGYNLWFFTQVEIMESNFSESMSLFQRAASIQREISTDYAFEIAPIRMSFKDMRESYVFACDAAMKFAAEMPEIEILGDRWAANRSILIAVLHDFTEFLQRAIKTIDEVDFQIAPDH